jgi:diguanylate cyclase (GGDEF)-like protein/PAS domain S-box-containing protein
MIRPEPAALDRSPDLELPEPDFGVELPMGLERPSPNRARHTPLASATPLGTWEADFRLARLHWSREISRLLGIGVDARPSLRAFLKVVHPDDRRIVVAEVRRCLKEKRPFRIEHRVAHGNGSVRFIRHSAEYRLDSGGNPIWIRGILEDVTEQRCAEEEAWYRSNFDSLTRLPKRAMFRELLGRILALGQRSHTLVAVLYLDIDRFRVINETMGVEIGDSLLRQVADRLRKTLRSSDCIARNNGEARPALARLGSDEFVVAFGDAKAPEGAARAARRVLDAMRERFVVGDKEIFLTVTIGIAVHPPDGKDSESLLQHAETAMHHAKGQGHNSYRFYADAMNESVMRRLDLESRLHKALDHHQFFLHYQPLVDIANQTLVGVEALLRWDCPELGRVGPAEFIPIAEENLELIAPIEDWVLRTACLQVRAWNGETLLPLRLSVNVSRCRLKQSDFATTVAEILKETAFDSRQLQIELTENGAIGEDPVTLSQLQQLKDLGVTLVVDDFGIGSSALGYLRKFPVDVLKIDRSFVSRIPEDPHDSAFVAAIITMAHRLGISVVAEGVENEEQLEFLRRNDCDEAQGFFLAEPLSVDAFRQLLAASSGGSTADPGCRQTGAGAGLIL